jgi:hypothetical protein
VTQQIGEIIHPAPVDFRCSLFDVIGKASRRFACDFEIPLGGHPPDIVSVELLEAHTGEHRFDFPNGFQDVLQSVFDGGRHLEHLNQVVGDAVSQTWFQQLPERNLDVDTGCIFDQVLNLEKIERRRFLMGYRIDQDIKVTVRARIAPRARAENGKSRDALCPYRGFDFAKLCDDRAQRNVDDITHG